MSADVLVYLDFWCCERVCFGLSLGCVAVYICFLIELLISTVANYYKETELPFFLIEASSLLVFESAWSSAIVRGPVIVRVVGLANPISEMAFNTQGSYDFLKP